MLQQMQQRQRRLSLPQILPEGLAQVFTIGGIVQRIVRQLERNAQPLPKSKQRLL